MITLFNTFISTALIRASITKLSESVLNTFDKHHKRKQAFLDQESTHINFKSFKYTFKDCIIASLFF